MKPTSDPRWQKRRLQILNRDNFKCVVCLDDKSELHVHHKRYIGNLWDAKDDDLQTLCDKCHRALGKHPKGGIWWQVHGDGPENTYGYSWESCPMCGSKDLRNKGSHDKCNQCGHPIVPDAEPIWTKKA